MEKNQRKPHRKVFGRPVLTSYIILVLVCTLFVLWVGATEQPEIWSDRTPGPVQILRNTEYEKVPDSDAMQGYYYRFRFHIDASYQKSYQGEVFLAYRMIHEYTQVLIGGKTVYAVYPAAVSRSGMSGRVSFGKTDGNTWGMVPLYGTDFGKDVEVRIYPIYKGVESVPDEFLLGDRAEIMRRESRLAAPSLVLSIAALIIGLAYMLMSRLGSNGNRESSVALRCLGFFAVLLGCWRLSDMRVTTLLMPQTSVFMSYVTLLSLMLVPIPMAFYLWAKLRLPQNMLHVVAGAFLAIDAAILLMQVFGIRDIRENLTLIHLSDVAAMAVVLFSVLWARKKNKKGLEPGLNVWVVLVVFAGILADLWEYYFVSRDRNMIWTVLAVDVYVVATGVNFIRRMHREAEVDAATGIYNKNRCMEVISDPEPAPDGTMFIMCDLNRLKYVNDNEGHEKGDLMIRTFAEALRETFARESDFIGRYGGDEFVVILDNVWSREQAERQIARIQNAVDRKQAEHREIPLSFACGWCLGADYPGENLEFLLRKADMEMYLNKKAWYDRHHLTGRGVAAETK